jgi:hypothetical protein
MGLIPMGPNKGIRQQSGPLIVPDSTSLTVQPAKQTIKLMQFPKKGGYVRLILMAGLPAASELVAPGACVVVPEFMWRGSKVLLFN